MLYIHVWFTKSSQELFSREMCFFSNKTTDKNNKRHHKKGPAGDTAVLWEVTRRGHARLIRKGRGCRKPPPALLEKMGRTSPTVRQAGGKVRVWVPEWQHSSNKPTIQKAGGQPPAVSTQSSKISALGLPWWSSGFKTLCSQHWGHRFNPWSGN